MQIDTSLIISLLLGDGGIEQFIVAMFYAYVGALLLVLISSNKKNSRKEPFKFTWKNLWCDHTKRIIANLIAIFIAIRFSRDILGADITMYMAFAIGLGIDGIIQLIQRKTSILPEKTKEKESDPEKNE
jgi:hypothetical protein